MSSLKDQAEARSHDLNRQNANLKFSCQKLTLNNNYLLNQVDVLAERMTELE